MKTFVVAFVVVVWAAVPALADKKLDEAVAKAEEQLQKGKIEEALKTLQKLASQNPASAETLFQLGRFQERLGQIDEALASLTKAADMSAAPASARAEALAGLASLKLRRGPSSAALAHAREAVKLEATPATLAALARAQIRIEGPKAALGTADKAVQAGATSVPAHEARGEALFALGRLDDAAAALRKTVELDPKQARPMVRLAEVLLAQGKTAEARAEAQKAADADAKSGEAFAVLGLAILKANPSSWGDAIAQAQQGAFLEPNNPAVQLAVGRIFEANSNLLQASSAYRRAGEADPQFVPARVALVDILIRKGELDAALTEAKKAVAEVPNSGPANVALGEVLLRKKDYEAALPVLEKAAAHAPSVAAAHAMLANAYFFKAKPAEAAGACRNAVELEPSNVDYRTTCGLLLGRNGQYEEGLAHLKKVVATPGYKKPDAWVNLGWLYRNITPKQTEDSVAAYKKALEIDPKNEQAALGLGWAHAYAKTWDESITAFRKAMTIEPTLAAEANNGIAWAHFFKKDMPSAKDYLAKAEAAGRADLRLKEQIERIEKMAEAEKAKAIAESEGPEGPDLPTLVKALTNGNVAAKRKAARDLAVLGREAAPWLGHVLMTEPDLGVRETAVRSLQAMGAAAKEALPQLQVVARYERTPKIDATRAEMEIEAREIDLIKAARELVQRLK